MTDDEIIQLCRKVRTWDQAHLDSIIGREAIKFAQDHEADVRTLASEMWNAFPLGANWWRIKSALHDKKAKDAAIIKRAEQIGKDGVSGKIVVRFGRLEYSQP